uniref:Transposase n=1 Tax=Strongyloides papillosus TaxID=174720 RepID=A0A0N5C0Y7_STREA
MENPIYYVTLDLTPKCLCGNEQVSVTLQSIKDGQTLVKEYYHGFNITESCKKLQRFTGLNIAKNLFQYPKQVSVTLQSIKDGQTLVKEYYHGFNITESCKKLQRFTGLNIAKNLFQ